MAQFAENCCRAPAPLGLNCLQHWCVLVPGAVYSPIWMFRTKGAHGVVAAPCKHGKRTETTVGLLNDNAASERVIVPAHFFMREGSCSE